MTFITLVEAIPFDSLNFHYFASNIFLAILAKNINQGFSEKPPEKKLVMLVEESGELAKAIRQAIGISFSKTTAKEELRA